MASQIDSVTGRPSSDAVQCNALQKEQWHCRRKLSSLKHSAMSVRSLGVFLTAKKCVSKIATRNRGPQKGGTVGSQLTTIDTQAITVATTFLKVSSIRKDKTDKSERKQHIRTQHACMSKMPIMRATIIRDLISNRKTEISSNQQRMLMLSSSSSVSPSEVMSAFSSIELSAETAFRTRSGRPSASRILD